MNKMDKKLLNMKETGRKILITYFPLCDPAMGDPVCAAKNYIEGGADVLEMGLPFNNPVLDGKTVKDSMARALQDHNIDDAFQAIKRVREKFPDQILQVMTYFDIIERMGMTEFAERCYEAGADAVLTPNIPEDKILELDQVLNAKGLIQLRFSPYHLTDKAMEDLKKNARGYIFQQAVDGGTGKQSKVSPQAGENANVLRKIGITTPICGGFGISNGEQANDMKNMGLDGIICGSAVIDAILTNSLKQFIQSLRSGLDS